MTERSAWTDERIDDLVAALYARFDQMDARMERFERRLDGVSSELREVRTELGALNRQFALIGWGALATVIVNSLIGVAVGLAAG